MSIVLLIMLIIPAFSCNRDLFIQSDDKKINIREWEMSDLPDISYLLTNSFTKIQPNTLKAGRADYICHMAKNEAESCQLILRSVVKLENLSIEAENHEEIAIELLREYYIETQDGIYFPDPLVPATKNFTLIPDENLVFLIKFKTTAKTTAGDYEFHFKITQNGGQDLILFKITVHVWNFTLPDSSSCATAVGLYPEFINKMHGLTSEIAQTEMYKKYYDHLLENRICAYTLPYDILDKRADGYLDNPCVTNLVIPYSKDDETILRYFKKLSSNPLWFAKAVFYPLDEPTSVKHLDELKKICERLERLYPGYQIVTPFFTNIQYDSSTDQIDFMTGLTNIWCPKTYMYITSNIYTEEQLLKYAPFGKRMEDRKTAGDRIWWYVCWEPGDPYCNLFIDMDGIMHRLLFWQQKLYDVGGFLYWGADYWRDTEDPWKDMRTVKGLSMDVFGDGSLIYNGTKAGIDGPAGSMRIETIRDGIEDIDMFTLAEKYLGREYVHDMISKITASVIKYTKNEDRFIAVRKDIGDRLEKVFNSRSDSNNQ